MKKHLVYYIYTYIFIAYGDSGCCTSPRPESTQSTVSTRSAISNTTKMQNGNTTSKDEPVLNGKDDIHDDRVPCEFCGELRCKETIMRHQVCKLFGKTIMVFLLDNFVHDSILRIKTSL